MIKCSLEKINNLDSNDINIIVEIPTKKEFGDYSTNVALTLTKKLHQSPMDIAFEIKNNFNNDLTMIDYNGINIERVKLYIEAEELKTFLKQCGKCSYEKTSQD